MSVLCGSIIVSSRAKVRRRTSGVVVLLFAVRLLGIMCSVVTVLWLGRGSLDSVDVGLSSVRMSVRTMLVLRKASR